MTEVFILTINKMFPQSLYPWENLSLNDLKEELIKYNINGITIDLFDLDPEFLKENSNKILITGSTQNPYLKPILDDYIYWLEVAGNKVIPSYNQIKAHENKGFQSLAMKFFFEESLASKYKISEAIKFSNSSVYKLPFGASGTGVFRAENERQWNRIISKHLIRNLRLATIKPYLFQKIKKHLIFKWRYSSDKERYLKPYLPIVEQEFIPNLSFDYKVLIFGDLFFVLKRNVNKGNFKASGSNNFEFVLEPVLPVLQFAKDVFNILKSPYVSLDIILTNEGNTKLIEYQCCHFGPYTFNTAPKVYKNIGDKWTVEPWAHQKLEWAYAYALNFFLNPSSN